MKKENLLIVCFDIKDFNKIDKIDLSNYDKVIVASDDFRVHEECDKVDLESKYIDTAICYNEIANDLIQIVDSINLNISNYLEQNDIDKKVFQWTKHPEGGRTTQIVQNMLILFESFSKMLNHNQIKNIILLNCNNNLESKVLKEIANSKNISLETIIKSSVLKNFFRKENLKLNFATYYRLLKTFLIKIRNQKLKNTIENKNLALFHLCADSKKHIDNIDFLIDSIREKEFNTVIVSWDVKRLISKFGNSHIILENYLSLGQIIKSLFLTLKLSMSKIALSENQSIFYKKFRVDDILRPYIHSSIVEFVPYNTNLNLAFSSFLKEYTEIKVAKLCHPIMMNDATVLYNSLAKKNILQLDYQVGAMLSSPYRKNVVKENHTFFDEKFIFFATGEIERDIFIDDSQLNSKNCVLMGRGKSGSLEKFFSNTSKASSLEYLNIKREFTTFVLVDFPSALKGYQSIEEVVRVFRCILELSCQHKNIAFLIKPHPSAKLNLMYSLLDSKLQSNIIVFEKTTDIKHLLNISDILITKYSNIGIEAIFNNTLIISTLFDDSDFFKIYNDAASYVYNERELLALLNEVFENKDDFKNRMKPNMKQFLDRYYTHTELSSAEIIANELEKRIFN
ncbi:MAG: CDP-glycerol glycerophosphotransferase family protein [Aliarcobacter butzleri]|nr:CDP-glycerol glycerophosphotransferase family protein [Aliarcobacter butzleri]